MRETTTILNGIAIIVLGLSLFFNAMNDNEQTKRIKCLEFGATYVGDEFCYK